MSVAAGPFWSRVEQGDDDACWPWTGYRNAQGYGRLAWPHGSRSLILAHRLAYALSVGPVPLELCVLHRCDNPPCCNPAHLFLGTRADNVADMHAKGRARSSMGSSVHTAKLSEEDVRSIRAIQPREAPCSGALVDQLAERFNVHPQTIRRVLKRRAWAVVA